MFLINLRYLERLEDNSKTTESGQQKPQHLKPEQTIMLYCDCIMIVFHFL